jgi:hypothetical protein
LMVKQREELDDKKRLGILHDLQKELAVQMPTIPWPGAANGFSLAWPYMANFGVLNPRSVITAPAEVWPSYWYDASKNSLRSLRARCDGPCWETRPNCSGLLSASE